jgi:S-adenosylmethionine:tRNA ribosyltransferase-isomerase
MKKLEIKGVDTVEMTMHVGLGTFRQVEVEDLSKHKMESEQFWLYPETAERVNQAKAEKRRVCAVGTSVIRSLESSTITDNRIKAGNGWTSKFIFPPHEFSVANSLITNLHAPQSTMLMLTAAFAGYELTMDVYRTAVKEGYRFLSYGDALLFV